MLMELMQPADMLGDMKKTLDELVRKVDTLLQRQESPFKEPLIKGKGPLDAITLLSLSAKLRKTATILCELGEATAEDVAARTKKKRAVESAYLNQLYEKGYIEKKRKSHTVYFYIPES
jgi:predicted transcriptional regulator